MSAGTALLRVAANGAVPPTADERSSSRYLPSEITGNSVDNSARHSIPDSSVENSARYSARSIDAETDDDEDEDVDVTDEAGPPVHRSKPAVVPASAAAAAMSERASERLSAGSVESEGEPDPLVLMWAAEQKAKRTAPKPQLQRKISNVL